MIYEIYDSSQAIFPALIAAGAALGGSLLSSISSSNSSKAALQAQREANETNLQISRETNQANLDLYREQLRDARELRDENNEYNSPLAQRQRMSEAGLNPALALGSSVPAAMAQLPSAAPAQGAHMEVSPYDAYSDTFLSHAAEVVPQIAESINQVENARATHIDNMTRDAYNRRKIEEVESNIDLQLSNGKLNDKERDVLEAQKDSIRLMNRLNEDKYQDSVAITKLDRQFRELQMRVVADQNNREAARLIIDTLNGQSQRALNAKQQWQIGEMVKLARNADWRDNVESLDKSWMATLDRQLKQLQISENDKQYAFNEVMRNLTEQHEVLKSKSYINKAVEYCFGLGFRDLGNSLKEFLNSSK